MFGVRGQTNDNGHIIPQRAAQTLIEDSKHGLEPVSIKSAGTCHCKQFVAECTVDQELIRRLAGEKNKCTLLRVSCSANLC